MATHTMHETTAPTEATRPAERLAGLDGLRGLAALYVLLFHCWMLTFRGFPKNNGPAWLGPLVYGHLAVVFFLVLSGFSLAVSPARRGWRLGGLGRYARRRAWRILPPYWAALVISLIIAWTITPQPHSGPPTERSVLVYGLLLQDLIAVPTPNGAFWSISVEAALYLAFPVLLLILRKAGAAAVLAVATVPVVVVGLLTSPPPPTDRITGLTFELIPLFTVGMVAAGVVGASERVRRLPWHWLTLLAAAPVLTVMVVQGSVWTAHRFYWLDLAIGPAMALLIAAVATGRPAALVRFLDSRPLRGLGRFSYSLYLLHFPMVVVISQQVADSSVPRGVPAFWVTLGLGLIICVPFARLFAAVFEIPFQRHRDPRSLAAAARSRFASS